MYYENNVIKIIKNFIDESGLEVGDLIIRKKVRYGKDADECNKGVMSFKGKTQTILFEIERLNQFKKNIPYIHANDLVILCFIHELGHYFHWKKEKDEIIALKEQNKGNKDKKWKYPIELAAWEYGKKYVSENLKEDYDFINKVNLSFYEEQKNGLELLEERRLAFFLEMPIDKMLSLSKSALNKVIEWPNSFARSCTKSELLQDIGEFLNLEEFGTQNCMKEYQNEMNYVIVKDGKKTRLIVRSPYNFFEVVGCFELEGQNKLVTPTSFGQLCIEK